MSAERASRLRVGVVGTGHWATAAHIPGFQACPDVEIMAICSRSPARGEEVARAFGIPHVYTSAEAMVARTALDLVSIVTPDDRHLADADAAISAGLHVLCEKPLARTLDDACRMADAARSARVLTKVGFTMRYAPAVIRLRELIVSEALGRPYLLEAFLQNGQFLSPERPLHWKMTREHAGAGAVVEYGIHGLDLAQWLLGEVRRVCAAGRTMIPERPLPSGNGVAKVEVDDSCAWLMDFANGALGVCHAGWATVGRAPGLELRVYGSRGAAQCILSDELPGGESLRLAYAEDQRFLPAEIPARLSGSMPAAEPWWRRFHGNLIRQFVDAIRTNAAAAPTFEDGVRAQELLAALLRSMDEGRWVSLPLEA